MAPRLALLCVVLVAVPLHAAGAAVQDPYSGSQPLGVWLEALAVDPAASRVAAADAIADIAIRHGGSAVAGAVPVLVENLRSGDPSVRRSAARALEQIGQPAKAGVPALSAMFERDAEPE
jgi:HEAT repeat protein